MKYMGSKRKYAQTLLTIMLQNRQQHQYYVEPMCGGCNVIDKADGLRMANDSHFYLYALLTALQSGWNPPRSVTEEEYTHMKTNKSCYDPALVGYVGFQLSYGAKWFGGFRRDSEGKRNYAIEAYNNTIKQIPALRAIVFTNLSYEALSLPPHSIVYFDPPYKHTTKYSTAQIDHTVFWEHCRSVSAQGHTVFVSEYEAPDDFTCVWSAETPSSLTRNTGGKTAVECLFTLTFAS
jgi:DNA adenine methylase